MNPKYFIWVTIIAILAAAWASNHYAKMPVEENSKPVKVDDGTIEWQLDDIKIKTLAEYNAIEKAVSARIESSVDSAIQGYLKDLLDKIEQKKNRIVKSVEETKRLFREMGDAEVAIDKLLKPPNKGVKSNFPFD